MHEFRGEIGRLPVAMLSPRVIRGLQRHGFRVFGSLLYGRPTGDGREGPRFLMRVGGFPHPQSEPGAYERLLGNFHQRGIRYVLGVTPFSSCDDGQPHEFSTRDYDQLRELSAEGVELALHGFTHACRRAADGWPSDTAFYSDDELRSWIQRGFEWFQRARLPPPAHYIPSFNSLTSRDFSVLGETFGVIHGGPLSLSTLGKLTSGRDDQTGVLYLPSYEPFYGRAEALCKLLEPSPAFLRRIGPQVLTLQRSLEEPSGFRHVFRLLDLLERRGWVMDPWSM